jgi:hypothetical protein
MIAAIPDGPEIFEFLSERIKNLALLPALLFERLPAAEKRAAVEEIVSDAIERGDGAVLAGVWEGLSPLAYRSVDADDPVGQFVEPILRLAGDEGCTGAELVASFIAAMPPDSARRATAQIVCRACAADLSLMPVLFNRLAGAP